MMASCSFRKKVFERTTPTPPSHELWDTLLKQHVNEEGMVSYTGFIKDSLILNQYLDSLSDRAPDPKSWTKEEQLAYWINAYNAFTVQLVIRNYPIKSIKDIATGLNIPFVSTTWDIKFINIGDEIIDLNRIEHGIIRKSFNDARIHFAVNCASMSCPKLRKEAYIGSMLNQQLDDQTLFFLQDPLYNEINAPGRAELSKLFTWFSGDFKKHAGGVIPFINDFLDKPLSKKAKLTYREYDWQLNEWNQKD
jgi:hypothetical protein